jgi:lipopolysaccharide export system protein LptA
MAASYPNAVRRRPLALALLGALLACGAAAAPHDTQAPINLEAASSDFDYRNNTLVFRQIKITQGELTVEAAEANATGLEFANASWALKGDVRITMPDGKLAANDAVVSFRDNQISRAEVRGKPAAFEQRLKESGQLARGRADAIEYDVRNGTVQLSGDAWLSDGQNEIRGSTLIYDIARQRVAANPGATAPGGVRITINPKEPPGRGNDKPGKPSKPAPQDPAGATGAPATPPGTPRR